MSDKKIEETEEKPKAVVAMEENSDAGKIKKKQEEENKIKVKKANKKFIIKYLLFIIILAGLTAVAIFYSIEYLNKINTEDEKIEIGETSTSKIVAEDSKYAITSYCETYDENAITIKKYDKNGKEITDDRVGVYVQIEGLLDKTIEEGINKRIKKAEEELSKNASIITYTSVFANFGNVLSVSINNTKGEYRNFNINLVTGEDVKFEDIFVSSAPINSFITEGVFKTLAWDELANNYEETEGFLDLDKSDTSNYEDIALQIVNKYKKNKYNIDFCITPSSVRIYKLFDNEYTNSIEIEFLEHKDEIAIYKRFLTENSIFENDSIGKKGIVVFTGSDSNMENLTYGKVEDNVFIEEVLMDWINKDDIDESTHKKLRQYIIDLVESDKKEVKSKITDNQGIFYQKEFYVGSTDEYYYASIWAYEATCDIEYFKNEAFKDYAIMKASPRADLGLNGFTEYADVVFKNLNISEPENSILYFDKEGNFLGTAWGEIKEKMKQEEENKKSQTAEETVNAQSISEDWWKEYNLAIDNLDTKYFVTDFETYKSSNESKQLTNKQISEIAEKGFEESAKRIAGEGASDKDTERIVLEEIIPNNYFTRKYHKSNAIYQNLKMKAYVVTRENEMGCGIKIYIDPTTALIVGGEAYGD